MIGERQLHRHRTRAGHRIGDGKVVDLFRYVAWLVSIRHAPKPESERDGLSGYDAERERQRARAVALSHFGRNIGELPPVGDVERKIRCARSFRGFFDTYLPQTFHLPWSDG